MDIKKLHALFIECEGKVSTDSREETDGAMFFALKGDNFDGNVYAHKALENGCRYAVVDKADCAVDDRFLLVKDVLKALQGLATFHRNQYDIPVVAITGTNGKTTTKELVAAVLKMRWNVLYTQGNFNNHIGVPLTLLQLRKEHEMAIVEMGANHPGEIRELSNIACPTAGLITNIGKAHLEGFGSLENILATKTELYKYLTMHEGVIFANEDNIYLKRELALEEYVNYAIEYKVAQVIGEVQESSPYLKMTWRADGETHQVNTNLIGIYNAENVLAAVTIGRHFSVEAADICKAIEEYVPTNNRSQLQKTEKNVLIVDAYNANPTSMLNAMKNFQVMEAENKYLILGDMLELGEHAELEHSNIVQNVNAMKFENVMFVGAEFMEVESVHKKFLNCEELDAYLAEHPIENGTILIKGSRGIGLERIIHLL